MKRCPLRIGRSAHLVGGTTHEILTTTGVTEAGVVEHMLVQGTTVGIEADGQGMVVRNNRILDIGPGVSLAIGIYVNGGSSGHVHDNEIVNMLGNSKTSPWGIEVFN